MRIEELIKKLVALQNAYGNYKVFLKENENSIRIIEDIVLEEAILMIDDEKVGNHNYFLIGWKGKNERFSNDFGIKRIIN